MQAHLIRDSSRAYTREYVPVVDTCDVGLGHWAKSDPV